MFQVASRPSVPHLASAPEMYILPVNYNPPVPHNVQLPRTLARPTFSEVSPSVIASLEPELAGVPIDYIRKNLAGQANQCVFDVGSELHHETEICLF